LRPKLLRRDREAVVRPILKTVIGKYHDSSVSVDCRSRRGSCQRRKCRSRRHCRTVCGLSLGRVNLCLFLWLVASC
jgi:hypothetical protein